MTRLWQDLEFSAHRKGLHKFYPEISVDFREFLPDIQGDSNMTGTDLCVNKPHCAAAVRP